MLRTLQSSFRHFSSTALECAVGNTPLLYLKAASQKAGCNVFGKAEFMNPGGSVKDRAALWIVREAEKSGELIRGQSGLIVEGTAGNTGIGLGLVSKVFGYDTIIVIPKTQTQEKKDQLIYSGCKLIEVEACPYRDKNHYTKIAQRLADNIKSSNKYRVLYANQWDNLANQLSHIQGTGPEIWKQTNHNINAFSCAVGTGGTLTGVGKFLRLVDSNVKICLTDPKGACIYRWYTEGELRAEGSSISEGIGQARITGQLAHEEFRPDLALEVDDSDMMEALQDLQSVDGLMCGLSTGINVQGAIESARRLGLSKNDTIVTVLCDLGARYATKQYNVPFLKSQNLPVPDWLHVEKSESGTKNGNSDSPIAVNPFSEDKLLTKCLYDAVV